MKVSAERREDLEVFQYDNAVFGQKLAAQDSFLLGTQGGMMVSTCQCRYG